MSSSEDKHAPSIYAIWHDPTTYDHLKMGPPYLPGGDTSKAAGRSKASSQQLRPIVETLSNAGTLQEVDVSVLVQDYGQQPMAWLAALLAMMRGENFVHLSHHWQSKGPTSYGDHLMFERIYNDLLKLIDKVAERAVGLGSPVLVDPVVQSNHQLAFVHGLYRMAPASMSPDACVLLSLIAVYNVLVHVPIVRSKLSEAGQLTPGVDNLLQEVADHHEEFGYLLKQRLGV